MTATAGMPPPRRFARPVPRCRRRRREDCNRCADADERSAVFPCRVHCSPCQQNFPERRQAIPGVFHRRRWKTQAAPENEGARVGCLCAFSLMGLCVLVSCDFARDFASGLEADRAPPCGLSPLGGVLARVSTTLLVASAAREAYFSRGPWREHLAASLHLEHRRRLRRCACPLLQHLQAPGCLIRHHSLAHELLLQFFVGFFFSSFFFGFLDAGKLAQ